jgi:hypothetical protein
VRLCSSSSSNQGAGAESVSRVPCTQVSRCT